MANFWDNLLEDDEHAASYMQTYGEGPGFATRHLIGSFINYGETVLDVGCGPGWNLDHFMEHGPGIAAYKGYDYSERFVRVANERAKQLAKTSTGPFHIGDVRDIKEPDESWDVVIMQDVLEHTNGYKTPIKEALRVAKRRVILTFWHLTENDDHINDDGNDGWGAWYSRPKLETFLNSLPYIWFDTELKPEEKNHSWNYYIIDKGTQQ